MEVAAIPEAPARILVVDDEEAILGVLSEFLTGEGFSVQTASSGEEALQRLKDERFDVLLTDLEMPGTGGLALLREASALRAPPLAVMMTGYGTVESAIAAMREGAHDFVLKPFKLDQMGHVVRRAVDRVRLQNENVRLKEALALYHLSEVMSVTSGMELPLQLIADTTRKETDADAVEILVHEKKGTDIVLSVRSTADSVDFQALHAVMDREVLLDLHRRGVPVVFGHPGIASIFPAAPIGRPLVSFISVPLPSHQGILGLLNAYSFTRRFEFTEGHRKVAAIMASRAAGMIERIRLYEELLATIRHTIRGFVQALEVRDTDTSGHSARVARYTVLVAKESGVKGSALNDVELGALLHDIGKIGISDAILRKAGPLTPEETAEMRRHPELGFKILSGIEFLKGASEIPLYHHEAVDGSGYPYGLKGDTIPIAARVFAVADAFDAITSDRVYRRRRSFEEARNELLRFQGKQFDPDVVKAFLRIDPEVWVRLAGD